MSKHEEHARRWITALTTDTAAAVAVRRRPVYDDHADSDHVTDTAITKDELAPKLAPYANTDTANGVGLHSFEITDSFPVAGVAGNPAVVILWNWTGTGLETYKGVPAQGKTLSTRGITWHQLDSDGQIVRETTYWNDTPVLQELGIPIITPEYWVEGFDRPSSLDPDHVGAVAGRARSGMYLLQGQGRDRRW